MRYGQRNHGTKIPLTLLTHDPSRRCRIHLEGQCAFDRKA